MPDEKLGGKCRERGCFKPAGHSDDHGIDQSVIDAHLAAMGPKDKIMVVSCPICAAAVKSDHSDGHDAYCEATSSEAFPGRGPCQCERRNVQQFDGEVTP